MSLQITWPICAIAPSQQPVLVWSTSWSTALWEKPPEKCTDYSSCLLCTRGVGGEVCQRDLVFSKGRNGVDHVKGDSYLHLLWPFSKAHCTQAWPFHGPAAAEFAKNTFNSAICNRSCVFVMQGKVLHKDQRASHLVFRTKIALIWFYSCVP